MLFLPLEFSFFLGICKGTVRTGGLGGEAGVEGRGELV